MLPGWQARLPLSPGRAVGTGGRCTEGGRAAQAGWAGIVGIGPGVRSPGSRNSENCFLHPMPSLSSCRNHKTLPEIFPNLVGTCCLHPLLPSNSRKLFKNTVHRMANGFQPCLLLSSWLKYIWRTFPPGLWVPLLPPQPTPLPCSLALRFFTWTLPRGHMLREEVWKEPW